MATLSTGQTGLQQVQRRRAIAQALQQQALSTAPVQHVNQGLARLVQAFAARKINKDADEKEGKITKERAAALARMLEPNVSYEKGPGIPASQHTLAGDPDALAQLRAGNGHPSLIEGGSDADIAAYDELIQRAQAGDPAALEQLKSGPGDPSLLGGSSADVAAYDKLIEQAQGSTFEIAAVPGKLNRVETEKTPNQLLQSMIQYSPAMAEQLIGGVLKDRFKPEPENTTNNITEWREAKAGGYPGSLQQWMDRNQNLGNDRGTDGAPSGWKWNKEGGLDFIKDGPADPDYLARIARNTPEAATKATLVARAASSNRQLAKIIFETDDNGIIKTDKDGKEMVHRTNIINMKAGTPWTVGRSANVLLKEAIEAKLRAESGAAVPTTEVERAAERFAPDISDSGDTIRLKHRLLQQFLDDAYNRMNKDGRFDLTGTVDAMLDDAAAQGVTGKANPPRPGDVRYDKHGNGVQLVEGVSGAPMWVPYKGDQ